MFCTWKFCNYSSLKVRKGKSLNDYFTKPELSGFLSKSFRFKKNTSAVLSSCMPDIEKVLNYLTKYPDLEILLEGHTDNVGDPVKNLNLSTERVIVIKKYFGIAGRWYLGRAFDY